MNAPTSPPLTAATALQDVLELERPVLSLVSNYLEAKDYRLLLGSLIERGKGSGFSVAHTGDTSSDELVQLCQLASCYRFVTNEVLSRHIGYLDPPGMAMRYTLKILLDGLSTTANSLHRSADTRNLIEANEALFNTAWKSLGQRLVDEHFLRDIPEGDELS